MTEFVPDKEETGTTKSTTQFVPDDSPTGVKRPSNPGKQFVAGVTDVGTSLPALVGLGLAGVDSLYSYATNDKGLKENFVNSLQHENVAPLMKASTDMQDWVNDKLGIKAPVSTEDQAARIIGSSVLPIPASALAGKAGTALAWLTPALRVGGPKVLGMGTAARGALQVGVGAGMDQGIKALADQPLMFSDEAINGTTQQASTEFIPDEVQQPTNTITVGSTQLVPDVAGTLDDDQFRQAYNNNLEAEVMQDQWTKALIVGAIGTAIIGGAASRAVGARAKDLKAARSASEVAPLGYSPTETKSVKQIARDLYGKIVDKRTIEADALRRGGWSENAILEHNNQVDTTFKSHGIFQQMWREGVSRITGRQASKSMGDLYAEFQGLDDNMKNVFNQGMIARAEMASRARSQTPSNLFNPSTGRSFTDVELRNAENLMNSFPALTRMASAMRENFDLVLDDAIALGVMSRDDAMRIRQDFTLNGVGAYMPFYQAKGKNGFMASMKEKWWPKDMAERQNEIGRLESRTYEAGEGTRNPLAPFEASQRYMQEMIDFTNRNAAGNNLVRRLSGLDPHMQPIPNYNMQSREAILIGKRHTNADGIEWDNNFLHDNSRMAKDVLRHEFKGNKENVLSNENVMTFRALGDEYIYYVPNKELRDTLKYRPELHTWMKAAQNMKDIFTAGTTGNLSLFAPISNMYSTAQIGMNAAITHGSLKELPRSVYDSAAGTWHLFANRMSKQVADNLTQRIASNTGLAKLNPAAAVSMRNYMQRKFEQSIINPIMRESGAFQTSMGSKASEVNVTNMIEQNLPRINDVWGQNFVRQTWGMWKHINEALREGPAVGRALREVGDIEGMTYQQARKRIRDGVSVAKDFSGDFARTGSSNVAKGINAAVPFSGAMIQSWNSIGRAIQKDWKMVMPVLIASTGIPTATELVYNKLLDQAYPEYGYNDYYWNQLTTQQRISNFVYFIPGLPPEQAILIPVAPELSLFRGTVIEGMDAAFDFSNVGMAGITQENGSHIWASLARALDIPLPPALAVAGDIVGVDLRIGPQEQVQQTGGQGITGIGGTQFGTGERLTGTGSGDKYVNDLVDQKTSAIVQDIFGAAGTTMLGVANAFNANLDRGIVEASSDAVDELTHTMNKQARYMQPLFGNALSLNPNNEVNRTVLSKVNGLKRMQSEFKTLSEAGRGSTSQPLAGNTVMPTEDLLYSEIASSAGDVMKALAPYDEMISWYRNQISSLGNADKNLLTGEELSVGSKYKEIEAYKNAIMTAKATQLMILQTHEKALEQNIQAKYNKPDFKLDFGTINSRKSGPGLLAVSPRQ